MIGIQFSKLADSEEGKSGKVGEGGGGEKSGNHVENYERSPSMQQ